MTSEAWKVPTAYDAGARWRSPPDRSGLTVAVDNPGQSAGSVGISTGEAATTSGKEPYVFCERSGKLRLRSRIRVA